MKPPPELALYHQSLMASDTLYLVYDYIRRLMTWPYVTIISKEGEKFFDKLVKELGTKSLTVNTDSISLPRCCSVPTIPQ